MRDRKPEQSDEHSGIAEVFDSLYYNLDTILKISDW